MPEPAQAPPLIAFRGVGKSFHADGKTVEAVRGVELDIRRGAFIALVGPSGCGKSTLLNMTAGLFQPTTGSVAYDGAPVSFTPLAVKETRVSDGTIAVIVEKPAPKMGFYIRAKPDWLRIDYANDQQPYEYRLDGATSAEVTAFAVGGPPGDWKPIVQNGSD